MQQQLIPYILYSILSLAVTACRKTEFRPAGTASLTIINAIPGTSSLVTNFSGTAPLSNYFINAKQLLYSTFQEDYQFQSYSDSQKLALYNYPDTLAKDAPLFDLTLYLPVGSINSLFLTGTPAKPDTLFITEHPPYHGPQDSTTGIRFINLSPGSDTVSINLQGRSNGSEIPNLPYKGTTAFKNYLATSAVSSYTFEFRNKATGELLGTYIAQGINNNSLNPDDPINKWRFRNHTLALTGLPGSGEQTVLLINNY